MIFKNLALNPRLRPVARNGRSALIEQPERLVTTTSSSKGQQVAAHQRHNDANQDDIQIGLNSYQIEQKHQTRVEHLELWHSVETIKRLGHRMARLDPLGLKRPESLADLSWSASLIEQMRSKTDTVSTNAFLDSKQPLMAVNELLDSVIHIYTKNECGLEFAHISNQQEVEWLTSYWERLDETFHLSQEDQQNLAKLLLECEAFDHFMAAKFPTTKRYGCEGAEPMLVVFDEIFRLCHSGAADADELTGALGQIDDVIIGMPHRGRLNLLACLIGFDPTAIFSKALGEPEIDLREAWMATGDVLSHLSTNGRYVYGFDRPHIGLWRETPEPINISLLPNPSHLEIVAPMVAGTARGRAHNIHQGYVSNPKLIINKSNARRASLDMSQDYTKYQANILPIQVHGDAAVAGQGIIQETLQMSNLAAFSVGGSFHLVVNNQIGYTTDSSAGRSSRHCTDVFKQIEAPIVHVNASNINSVLKATRLALAYRQNFGKDVALNLICYRQHGHNEMDEPAFTQPIMYSNIRSRKSIPQSYCDQIKLGTDKKNHIITAFKDKLATAYKGIDRFKPENDNYRNFNLASEFYRDNIVSWQTGCDLSLLKSVGLASVETPENFKVHHNLKRVLVSDRQQRFNPSQNADSIKVDWASAEILAFGSLMKQNHTIRIAGQDVARGTFSTRHAILFDQTTGEPYIPLNNLTCADGTKPKAKLEVANTILSEEAALAYEFGYSAETCELSIWEAQFGDFFNTAQSVIDTLISSSETKWLKQSALTMLLPHGLDGAGPEHSSSHIERFLQMCSSKSDSIDTEAKVNWSICFPTLPSQYFHLLRRQVLRPIRKPLVVMSPKSIFRHPDCVSSLTDCGPDETFKPVLDDPNVTDKSRVDRIVLCSGKVYFMLNELKKRETINNVALIRVEELCPFPIEALVKVFKQYPRVLRNKFYWFQEEHKNQGAYSFVHTRLDNMAGIKLEYIGRPESELPAIGSANLHKKELDHITNKFRSLKSN